MVEALEFNIGEINCCISVNQVIEIIKREEISPIPNSPEHVKGIMEWREGSLKIIDPKHLFDIENSDKKKKERVVVVERKDQEGWLVDEVNEVISFSEEEVDESTSHEAEKVKGIIKKEDDFILWVES